MVDLNGAATGGGQYDTISNWLTDLASLPVIPPDGDVGHAFDNNQKVGKTWHVAVENKVKSSVITTHIYGYLLINQVTCKKTSILNQFNGMKTNLWLERCATVFQYF